jgi:hypothetical protein
MGMSLQHDGPGAHHFPAFASLMAFGAHALKAPMRGRQRFGLGQGALASDFAGSIDIDYQPGLLTPIGDATRISKRGAGQQILLKQGTQAFHAGLIERR